MCLNMMIFFRKSFATGRTPGNREKELSREPFPTTLGRGGVGSPSFLVSHDLVVASAFSLVCTAGGLLCGDGKPLPEHSEEKGRWLAGKRVSGSNDEPNGQQMSSKWRPLTTLME
jgi:hypothetical protein